MNIFKQSLFAALMLVIISMTACSGDSGGSSGNSGGSTTGSLTGSGK